MWLFPLQSALFFEEMPAGETEMTAAEKKNARRALYNGLRWYPNKSKRQREAFIVELTAVLLRPDGMGLCFRDSQALKFVGVHTGLEKIYRDYFFFPLSS